VKDSKKTKSKGKNMQKYFISEKNLIGHELIGLQAKIVENRDKKKKGIQGKIVDETKNLLKIDTQKKVVTIPKKETILEIKLLNGKKVRVKGVQILEKPENRTKQFWKLKTR
jgi:ribonuclease P protein subunit POP4